MGWSFYRRIDIWPARVSFSGSGAGGSGGVKSARASAGPREAPDHRGRFVAGGCGCLSFLVFGGLFFLCFAVFSRLEPPPVAEGPPMEPPAERQQETEPKPIQPVIEEPEPKQPEPAMEQPTLPKPALGAEPPALPNPEPEAEPPPLPEFKLEPAPEPEHEPEPETKPLVQPQTVYRQWTDKTGEFLVEAEFVSMAMGKVKLRKADGEEVTLPLEQLSATDQQWIEQEKTSAASARARLSRDSRILSGSVIGVADGDTITVSDRARAEHQVRLQGIDAPEEGQAYSARQRKRSPREFSARAFGWSGKRRTETAGYSVTSFSGCDGSTRSWWRRAGHGIVSSPPATKSLRMPRRRPPASSSDCGPRRTRCRPGNSNRASLPRKPASRTNPRATSGSPAAAGCDTTAVAAIIRRATGARAGPTPERRARFVVGE